MRWKRLREGEGVEHRRGGGGKGIALGGGIGGIIMALIAIFVFKQPPAQVIGNMQNQGPAQQASKQPTQKELQVEEFLRKIKGSTDEIWSELFARANRQYRTPKLIDYDHTTRMTTGGVADARMGPFYLPVEQTIYLDIAFFDQMKTELGGGGDFAYAYVIAHEVGHHVQNLLGKTDYVHKRKGRISEVEYNRLSVRLELQADFLAGVWAHYADKKMHRTDGVGLLEEGDIEEAMNAAQAIGDDALQRKARGRIIEDSFTHGTSEQRRRWFIKGLRSGDLSQMDTFSIPYDQL